MQVKALWAGIGAGALWGFSVLAPKLTWNYDFWDVSFGRYVFYGIISFVHLALNYRSRKQWMTANALWTSFFFSLIANTVYYTLLVYCARRSGIALTSLMVGLIPVTVAIFGRTADLPFRRIAGPIALLTLGIFVLEWQEVRNLGHWDWVGFGLLVFEITIWTWYAIENAKFMKRNPKITGLIWSSLSGVTTLTSMVVAWGIYKYFWGEQWVAPVSEATPATLTTFLWVVAICGLGGSWVAFAWWNYASQVLKTSLTGQLMIFETLFALAYGWIYAGRFPTAHEIVATLLFVTGVRWSIKTAKTAG
ncbi:MAG: DMT family transporter [Bdellovibrionales bacterium]|nr:DMT family transporter [Bdellovibrionales bacterium]